MKVKISIPSITNYLEEFEWDTSKNFKPPCPHFSPHSLHGFPFKEVFRTFEGSGLEQMEGEIFCLAKGCPEKIYYRIKRADV